MYRVTGRSYPINAVADQVLTYYNSALSKTKGLPHFTKYQSFKQLSMDEKCEVLGQIVVVILQQNSAQHHAGRSHRDLEIESFISLGVDQSAVEYFLLYPDTIISVGPSAPKIFDGQRIIVLSDVFQSQPASALFRTVTPASEFLRQFLRQSDICQQDFSKPQQIIPADGSPEGDEGVENQQNGGSLNDEESQTVNNITQYYGYQMVEEPDLDQTCEADITSTNYDTQRPNLLHKGTKFAVDRLVATAQTGTLAQLKEQVGSYFELLQVDQVHEAEEEEQEEESEVESSEDSEDQPETTQKQIADELERQNKAYNVFAEELETSEAALYLQTNDASWLQYTTGSLYRDLDTPKALQKEVKVCIVQLNGNEKALQQLMDYIQFSSIKLVQNVLEGKQMLKFDGKQITVSNYNYTKHRDLIVAMLDHAFSLLHGLNEAYVEYKNKQAKFYKSNRLERIPLFLEESHSKNDTKIIFDELDDEKAIVTFIRPPAFEGWPTALQHAPIWLRNPDRLPRSRELTRFRQVLGYEKIPDPEWPTQKLEPLPEPLHPEPPMSNAHETEDIEDEEEDEDELSYTDPAESSSDYVPETYSDEEEEEKRRKIAEIQQLRAQKFQQLLLQREQYMQQKQAAQRAKQQRQPRQPRITPRTAVRTASIQIAAPPAFLFSAPPPPPIFAAKAEAKKVVDVLREFEAEYLLLMADVRQSANVNAITKAVWNYCRNAAMSVEDIKNGDESILKTIVQGMTREVVGGFKVLSSLAKLVIYGVVNIVLYGAKM